MSVDVSLQATSLWIASTALSNSSWMSFAAFSDPIHVKKDRNSLVEMQNPFIASSPCRIQQACIFNTLFVYSENSVLVMIIPTTVL